VTLLRIHTDASWSEEHQVGGWAADLDPFGEGALLHGPTPPRVRGPLAAEIYALECALEALRPMLAEEGACSVELWSDCRKAVTTLNYNRSRKARKPRRWDAEKAGADLASLHLKAALYRLPRTVMVECHWLPREDLRRVDFWARQETALQVRGRSPTTDDVSDETR